MHKVRLGEKTVLIEDGTVLADMLIKSGNYTEHICGGKGICKKCKVIVNGKEELSCQYKIRSDIVVETIESAEIYSETGAEISGELSDNVCFVLDIGTSTLALALVSEDNNEIIDVITNTNPQRVFGADVMSRIEYCKKKGALSLQKILIDKINIMTGKLYKDKVPRMYVTGNTVMLHLFFGIDCSGIGIAPYTPVFLESKSERGENLGIFSAEAVISLPSVSSFVGADIVAGLNFCNLPPTGKYNILVDLGTNAEIVLYSENSILCTSAAAGPCFEGCNISCGMSATEGAIYYYSGSEIRTISDAPVKGICGTGLIDIIAYLIYNGIIDETGYLEEEFRITDTISLNQSDIRQFQLAKSAVYSGICTLMKKDNIDFSDIETVYISGGFSERIIIENAAVSGLIPNELKEKCKAINNSSLMGTVKYITQKSDLTRIINTAEYIDLSKDTCFSDFFIENIHF